MVNKEVVYVGPFAFPNGGAAARRILANCLSLQESGYNVTVASGQLAINKPISFEHGQIRVVSLEERTAEHLPKILKHLSYFRIGGKTIKWLDSLPNKPQAIILYSGYSPYLFRLRKWCRINKVKLLFDAVEWYDPPNKIQSLSPYYLNIELAMRLLIPKVGNVIAISRYLQNYYNDAGCKTVLIPPTLDTQMYNQEFEYASPDEVNLIYAGSPGHKDLLNHVISAVHELVSNSNKVNLHVAGLTNEQLHEYAKHHSIDHCLGEHVIAYGFLKQDEAMKLVARSDFSILIRPIARYSMAGFSTKFVESCAVGTPVIANITSDLDLYMVDKKNGLVCNDHNVTEIKSKLHEAIILKKNKEKYMVLRSEAQKTARTYFDYRKYSSALQEIVEAN